MLIPVLILPSISRTIQWANINALTAYSVTDIDLPIEFAYQMFYYHVYGLYATKSKVPIAWGNHMPNAYRTKVIIRKRSYYFSNNNSSSWVDWVHGDEGLTMIAIGV